LKTFGKSLAVALGAALLLAPAVSSAAEIVVKHAQGETTLPGVPSKVLVLDIPSLDTLDALGVDVAGVPGSNLPPYLSKYADEKYTKVGTLFEPDYEAVNAAGADLMIIGGRSAAKYPDLSGMLPTIDMTIDPAAYTDNVKANVVKLGEVFGKQAEATELTARLDGKLTALKGLAADAGTAMILVTTGGKVGAYGPASRVGWLHKEMGFKPVADDIDDRFHGGDVVSFEYILEANPDWIFVIDRDAAVGQVAEGQAAKQILDNELVAQTNAWKNGHVVYLDPAAAYIVSSGYNAINTLVDQVSEAVSAAK